METVTIHKAKTQLSRSIEKACEGEEIVISRGSKPVVRLVPIHDMRGNRKPGALKGKIQIGAEFFEPLLQKNWTAGNSPRCGYCSTRIRCFGGLARIRCYLLPSEG